MTTLHCAGDAEKEVRIQIRKAWVRDAKMPEREVEMPPGVSVFK
jgi:hypothetical protein